jgi:probable DNA metabolism protein
LLSYLHEESFEGMLSAVAVALAEEGDLCEFVTEDPGLLFGTVRVATDPARANGLLERLRCVGGSDTVHHVCQAYLADRPRIGDALFAYVRAVFAQGRSILGWTTNPVVRDIAERARLVGQETHRFKGLLRFMELRDGTYYAPFAPDHRVILPLAQYFAQRLGDQRWVIHDRKRRVAVLWDGRSLQPTEFDRDGDPRDWVSDAETVFQDCWRTYTRHIAIEERSNPRLQAQFMPRRYWEYLPEMNTANQDCGSRLLR